MKIQRIAQLKTADKFRDHLQTIEAKVPFDETLESGPNSPLAAGYQLKNGFRIGNRFSILPMEGWDGSPTGKPTELVERRWKNFGLSGAKLIWGCEAVAVQHDGRANPNQLLMNEANHSAIANLRESLVAAHRETYGETNDLLVGLQLTHSGRFARPDADRKLKPHILYHHPILDQKFGLAPEYPLMSDDDIKRLVDRFVEAAKMAETAGFHFVDVKHCHGYLGHEFLSAIDRNGMYGGSFENRTRFLKEIVEGIRANTHSLEIGVRLSAFDFVPFQKGENSLGEPATMPGTVYPYAFGADKTGLSIDFQETFRFIDLLQTLDIELLCITAGSPYYNPHIQRPAIFPPSDGYQPPEDPLVGVGRQIQATAQITQQYPDMAIVGSGYSYLQEWVPNVAQHVVREGMADFVGLGRMVLSYPDMPADILAGKTLQRKRICRTFSDCTTAPRNGMISGCFPLDPFYKEKPENEQLAALKKQMK